MGLSYTNTRLVTADEGSGSDGGQRSLSSGSNRDSRPGLTRHEEGGTEDESYVGGRWTI